MKGTCVEGFALRNRDDFRVFLTDEVSGMSVSPWHDIPLYVDKGARIVNFVNEIPKGSVEKMEISTNEPLNPIKQDIKKGNLRCYPFQSLVNYGALPQTWEDPNRKDEHTGFLGDKDPVDVVEIGHRIHACASVYPVKVLGILVSCD